MTLQYAKEILAGYKQRLIESCSNQLDKDIEAFNLAIKALDGAIICMSEVEMKPYFEGYKAGKEDFEPPKGEWVQIEIIDDDAEYGVNDDASECSNCKHIESSHYWTTTYYHYCPNCGAKMKGGVEE